VVAMMLNTLTGFEKLIQEHVSIRAHTKMISNLANDFTTLFSLQNDSTRFSPYQINYLSERRLNFKRVIISLSDSLIDHNSREEEIMQPLVGGPLLQAVKRDSRDVLEKLSELDWILLNTGPVGILFNSAFLNQKVDILCQKLDSSCLKQDSILEFLKTVPETSSP
jgi:hypothetical protein